MSADAQQALLLSDALDRVMASPGASHLWIHLVQLIRGISDPGVFSQVLSVITTRLPQQGLAGFYRATTLDIINGKPEHLQQACVCLQEVAPIDIDRCATFLNFAWQRALLHANDRAAFAWRIQSIGLPLLSQLIAGQLTQHTKAAARAAPTATRPRRVALVAANLISPAHPPTQMALDQARALWQQGVEVSLFSCQEANVPDAIHLLGNGLDNFLKPGKLQDWLRSVDNAVDVQLSDSRFSLLRRWRDMLAQIHAYRPDMVMFVGLQSGLVSALYRDYPVLGLSTNSIAPLVPTDAWLTAQEKLGGSVAAPWNGHFPDSQACYHPFRVRRKPVSAAMPRDSLGLAPDTVLMITTGNHLDHKISGEWAQRMLTAMQRHPQLAWLAIGGDGAIPPALEGLPPERLRVQPFTPDAMQWMAASDLYLHPPIMGGGFSVSEAMSLGLPVLALADSDGGDKLGAAADIDLDTYFARLDALASDAALRRSTGQQMRERFDSALDLEASGPSLLAACTTAMQRYQQRITTARV